MECAVYARVSTKLAKGIQNPEVQLQQLRKFAATQNWDIVAEFVDDESGANPNRPEFKRMMEAASRREFEVLLFWSIDRFSREGIVPVLTHLNRLTDYRIKYRSLQEPYLDTTHEWGDLIAAFAAKLAEVERNRIRARIIAGLEKARASGKKLGRQPIIVDRAKVWKLRESGLSIRRVASELRLSKATVQRIVAMHH